MPMGLLKQVPIGAENEGEQLWGKMACRFAWKGFNLTFGNEKKK